MARTENCAIGFRVKSGWAAAVLVGGPVDAPRAIARAVVELSDAEFPETRQPYHASTGREETDAAKIKRRVKIVERVAARSVKELIEQFRASAGRLRGAALVVGSTIEPADIANPHIRAHAHEGKLFRTVLESALRECGLRSHTIRERDAFAQAAVALECTEKQLKQNLTAIGKPLGSPWAGDQKLAAVAAWMTLA